MTRLVTVTCRMRHLAVWWGRTAVVLIWPLWRPTPLAPLFSLTTPRVGGGTFVVRLGPLLLTHTFARRHR